MPDGSDAMSGPSRTELYARLIQPKLHTVERPGRYTGGEPGQIIKDWDSTRLHFALAFPDLYELGMSYYGREVLYAEMNSIDGVLCERAFLPARDMQALMSDTGMPLWALESKRPLLDFDAIGISLTYELAYPAIVRLLQLAGLPVRAAQRTAAHPLVILGGQCMCNPEPVALFADLIVFGEGEEIVHELAAVLMEHKGMPRLELLLKLAQLPGCYVPQLYAPGADGVCVPVDAGVPRRIERRLVADFEATRIPVDPVQAYVELPSDKAYIEVMRGCPQGCRFCQAGYITRPARARSVAAIVSAAQHLARATGMNEIGLLSLSTLDHPQIVELVQAVKDALPDDVGVALPSLRADRMSAELAVAVRRPRETSLTLAVEAGDEKLRHALKKNVRDEDVLASMEHLMAAGWHKFKLYFMCGFQGEDLSAMDEIARLIGRIFELSRARGFKVPRLNIALSVLVPKPQTPFQWQAMERPERTREKQQQLASQLKRFGGLLKLHWHDAERSVIEALLGRGGRELAPVIEQACAAGQYQLDGRLDLPVWEAALQDAGLSLEHEVYRERQFTEALPWTHMEVGVRPEYLWQEWQAYLAGQGGEPCHQSCEQCGVGCAGPVFS